MKPRHWGIDPTVNVSKARQAVLEKLKQPALLTDRIQPIRRPTLRLKVRRRTNESN